MESNGVPIPLYPMDNAEVNLKRSGGWNQITFKVTSNPQPAIFYDSMAFSKAVSHQSPTDFKGVGCTPETPEHNPNWKKNPKSSSQLWDFHTRTAVRTRDFFRCNSKFFSLPKTQFPFFCSPDTHRGCGTYLCLELAFGEGHHLLIGHLGEEGSVLVQPEALQPGWDICSTKGRTGEFC